MHVLAYSLMGKDLPEALETATIQQAKALGVRVNAKGLDQVNLHSTGPVARNVPGSLQNFQDKA